MKAIRVYTNVEELIDVENNIDNYTTSRFFGIPYFEEGFAWPVDYKNRSLHFICQINLKEIESNLYEDLLPKEGILQFFFSGNFNQYCIKYIKPEYKYIKNFEKYKLEYLEFFNNKDYKMDFNGMIALECGIDIEDQDIFQNIVRLQSTPIKFSEIDINHTEFSYDVPEYAYIGGIPNMYWSGNEDMNDNNFCLLRLCQIAEPFENLTNDFTTTSFLIEKEDLKKLNFTNMRVWVER